MDRVSRDKLRWRSRRGLLELDLVLARFVPTLKEDEVASFSALLELPDKDLWDIVSGRSNGYDPTLDHIIARLRATSVARTSGAV
jgi:antitoxin CptB